MSRLLVLGMGDILNQDQGLGIHAVRDLHQENWPVEVEFGDNMNCYQSLDLQNYESLLILDIVHNGNDPGTVYKYTLKDIKQEKHLIRCHSLLNALTIADLSGHGLDVVFMGAEGKSFDWNLGLSSVLLHHYPYYLECVRSELRTRISKNNNFA